MDGFHIGCRRRSDLVPARRVRLRKPDSSAQSLIFLSRFLRLYRTSPTFTGTRHLIFRVLRLTIESGEQPWLLLSSLGDNCLISLSVALTHILGISYTSPSCAARTLSRAEVARRPLTSSFPTLLSVIWIVSKTDSDAYWIGVQVFLVSYAISILYTLK